jgi:hypothetical protein
MPNSASDSSQATPIVVAPPATIVQRRRNRKIDASSSSGSFEQGACAEREAGRVVTIAAPEHDPDDQNRRIKM